MKEMQDDDVIRCLEQVGEVKPTAEASRRALDRTRHALAAAPVIALAVKSGKWSTTSVSLVTGVVLLAGGLAAWLVLSPFGNRPALTFDTARSISYRQTSRIAGDPGTTTTRIFIRA